MLITLLDTCRDAIVDRTATEGERAALHVERRDAKAISYNRAQEVHPSKRRGHVDGTSSLPGFAPTKYATDNLNQAFDDAEAASTGKSDAPSEHAAIKRDAAARKVSDSTDRRVALRVGGIVVLELTHASEWLSGGEAG